ncbi:hypothetical protein EDC04DRAFT_2887043 [Pisolithus marmoratus]|nr:hypothetical protein EDC04DRAFT_2887043 [Pisolithus marmoratus]
MAGDVETPDWALVFQFISDPLELDIGSAIEKPVAERTEPPFGTVLVQVPTPPESCTSSPVDLPPDEDTLVSVSTTFFPGAQLCTLPPDLVLLSSDSVSFYVHTHILLAASDNNFNSLLPPSPRTDPGRLGLHVARSTSLYNLLLFHAPLYPLELYALAASYDLYDLAVPTSSHLLSFSLSALTDEMVNRIGAKYLKHLFFLHFGRSDALKRLLLPPPHPHPPTATCDFTEQKKLTRAWALTSAYFAWDARPWYVLFTRSIYITPDDEPGIDLSTSTLESTFAPLGEHLSCEQCKLALQERLKTLIVQWSVVKVRLCSGLWRDAEEVFREQYDIDTSCRPNVT